MFFALCTGIPAEENSMQNYQDKQKNRQIINARSLSLEVTKHKHRLAAQLVSETEFFLSILYHITFYSVSYKFSKSVKQKLIASHSIYTKFASSFH